MFIVIKSEHYDCTNLICKKDTLKIANTIAVLAGPVSRLRSSLPYRADAKFFGEIRRSESNQSTVAKRKNC